jgi:Zinc carboxypeptidase/Cytosolic carboxypeptidase N-terminal domain
MRTIHALFGLLALLPPQDSPAPLRVVSDFPGGSAQVDAVEQERRLVKIQPADRPGRGWRCWWYFRLEGVRPGETVTVEVEGNDFTLPERAAFSADGKTWRQTAAGEISGKHASYRQAVEGSTAWFAWGPPYLLADAQAAVRKAAKACPGSEVFTLCASRDGHAVPAVRFGPAAPDPARFGLWIQARQHAWESGGSWIAQGFLDWLASDAAEAKALRERCSITVVPIMDVDNVQRGAGGKQQTPHDHNRDWMAEPQHPEVKAAMERLLELDRAGAFDVFLDLHNPSAGEKHPYFYLPAPEIRKELGRRNEERLVAAARDRFTAPLSLAEKMKISGPAYDKDWKQISNCWIAMNLKEHVIGSTLETPWNTAASTVEGYAVVGRELGEALERYLRESPRK